MPPTPSDRSPRLSATALVRRLKNDRVTTSASTTAPGTRTAPAAATDVPSHPERAENSIAGAAYRRLAGQITNAALEGRIASGTALPSERELAAALQISRTTVAAGYALL